MKLEIRRNWIAKCDSDSDESGDIALSDQSEQSQVQRHANSIIPIHQGRHHRLLVPGAGLHRAAREYRAATRGSADCYRQQISISEYAVRIFIRKAYL